MIYDSINHIDFYLGSSKNLDKALAVIKMMDFDKLPMGDLVINNKVKIVKKNFSFPVKEKIFGELHSETIDIHLYGVLARKLFILNQTIIRFMKIYYYLTQRMMLLILKRANMIRVLL